MQTTTGQRFKELRLTTGLSQEDFGKVIGLTKSGVSNIENDKSFMSLDVQRTLVVNFNADLNYLVAGIGNLFLPDKYEDVKDEILKRVNEMLKDRGL